MNRVKVRTTGTGPSEYKGKAIQLWKQLERKRIKEGKRILSMTRWFDDGAVRIKVRATEFMAGNMAWIKFGGEWTSLLLYSDPRITVDPFWDWSGGYSCDVYEINDPYAKQGALTTGLAAFFPYNAYPIPVASEETPDEGYVNTIYTMTYTDFSGDYYLRVFIKRNGVTLYQDVILGQFGIGPPFSPGWMGDWVITSRPYDTSTITPSPADTYFPWVNMGVVGNVMMDGKLYTLFYETASGTRYWYLLGFSLEDGALVEDYLIPTSISNLFNSPSNAQAVLFFHGTSEVAGDNVMYTLRRSDADVVVLDITSGSLVQSIHSLSGLGGGTLELRDIAVTQTYVYVLTREYNGTSDWSMVVWRAPRFTTVAPTWTQILDVTTDGTWHYSGNSFYCFTVSDNDTKLITCWREGASSFLSTQRCYFKQYDITNVSLPGTPPVLEYSRDSLTDPTPNIIGLKYK